MLSLDALPASCTAEEATALVSTLAPVLGILQDLPDVRTLRLWRTKKLLTIEGRRFTRRNLLEILASLHLRRDGLTQQSAFKRISALDEERLRSLLEMPEVTVNRNDGEPLITLQLLAKGVLEQYQAVRKGAVVGHTDTFRTGVNNTPLSLHQAMARLGRHYFAEGREDRAASVHQLLSLCTTPLTAWAPQLISNLEGYRDAILIDPTYYVPNQDCEDIAEEAAGTNLNDLVERHLHEELRNRLQKLGKDADIAYTIVREFIGRNPLATAFELQHLYSNPELNDEVIRFVRDDLYVPVHASLASGGKVRRCLHCRAAIANTGHCILAGCSEDYATKEMDSVPLSEAYLARPEVLKYWADPAREELRLYDALRRNAKLRDHVYLYPHSDWCDVSIGEEVGIDVKDHQNPERLAHRLNRSLGNFGHYPKRILAIAKRRWFPIYRDRLTEHLSPERRASLMIMSVDQAISRAQGAYDGGHHAR